MNTFITALLIIVPAVVLFVSAAMTFKRKLEGRSSGKAMRVNLATFLVLILMVGVFTFAVSATNADVDAPEAVTTAEVQAEEKTEQASDSGKGLGLLAAGLVTGLAGIGGGIAVAAGAPAAIAATSEDPKAFGKSLIFVALGESIALYGVVISILILNKV
ncbi:MAG: ATP synthase subunit C [Acutalibacteraceae bacterium]